MVVDRGTADSIQLSTTQWARSWSAVLFVPFPSLESALLLSVMIALTSRPCNKAPGALRFRSLLISCTRNPDRTYFKVLEVRSTLVI